MMMLWYQNLPLVAQAEWYQRFRLRSNTDPRSLLALVLLLIGVVVVVWGASRWFQIRERRKRHSPRALFRELCRAHGLSARDRHVLWQLGCRHFVNQPAAIFVAPQYFEPQYFEPQYAAQGAVGCSTDAAELQRLRQQLFGALAVPLSANQPVEGKSL